MPKRKIIEPVTMSTYLVIENKARGPKIIKSVPNAPSLKATQTAVKINVTLSQLYLDEHFPVVNIEMPDAALLHPEIEIEVTDEEE